MGKTITAMHANITPAEPLKMLVIEDEGEMCLLVELLLDQTGITNEYVRTLGAAREFLAKQQPALVLLDNRLPDGFGIDFIKYIKDNYPGTRVILISGFDFEVEDVALEIGDDSFLPKPFY